MNYLSPNNEAEESLHEIMNAGDIRRSNVYTLGMDIANMEPKSKRSPK
jgi:hypothetical protein